MESQQTESDQTEPEQAAGAAPLLQVEGLRKYFPIKKGLLSRHVGDVKAVDGVSFELAHREMLSLVGESGCGKTTAGRTLLRLYGGLNYVGTRGNRFALEIGVPLHEDVRGVQVSTGITYGLGWRYGF